MRAEGLVGGRGEKEEGNVQEVGAEVSSLLARVVGIITPTYVPLEREHENFV